MIKNLLLDCIWIKNCIWIGAMLQIWNWHYQWALGWQLAPNLQMTDQMLLNKHSIIDIFSHFRFLILIFNIIVWIIKRKTRLCIQKRQNTFKISNRAKYFLKISASFHKKFSCYYIAALQENHIFRLQYLIPEPFKIGIIVANLDFQNLYK